MILVAASQDVFTRTFAQTGCTCREAVLCHQLADVFGSDRMFSMALDLTKWGLSLEPDQPDLLADQLIWSMEEDAKTIEDVARRVQKTSIDAIARLGFSLWERKLYKQAVLVFERGVEAKPQSATLWASLGSNCEAAGDVQRANECFARAMALDPINELARSSVQRSKKRSETAQTPQQTVP